MLTAQQAYDYALNQERSGNFQAAFETLVDLNRQYPRFADVEMRLANYTRQNYRYYGAQSLFTIEKLAPSNPPPPPAYQPAPQWSPPPGQATAVKKGSGGLVALLVFGLLLMVGAGGGLVFVLVSGKTSPEASTATTVADPLAPTLTAISKISVAPQPTQEGTTVAAAAGLTPKPTLTLPTPLALTTTAKTTAALPPTTTKPVTSVARTTAPAATTLPAGNLFKPFTAVAGVKEIPVDPQIQKGIAAALPEVPDITIRLYVSAATPEEFAASLHPLILAAGYEFAAPGETEPFGVELTTMGAYAREGQPDLLFAVRALGTDKDENGQILDELDLPNITEEMRSKILDQLQGKASFMMALSGTGLNLAFFSGG